MIRHIFAGHCPRIVRAGLSREVVDDFFDREFVVRGRDVRRLVGQRKLDRRVDKDAAPVIVIVDDVIHDIEQCPGLRRHIREPSRRTWASNQAFCISKAANTKSSLHSKCLSKAVLLMPTRPAPVQGRRCGSRRDRSAELPPWSAAAVLMTSFAGLRGFAEVYCKSTRVYRKSTYQVEEARLMPGIHRKTNRGFALTAAMRVRRLVRKSAQRLSRWGFWDSSSSG